MTRNLSTFLVALAVAACAAAPADAAKRFTIRGAGFGHGVGMSQYGAMGYASNGWDYKRILAHYYTGTALGVLKDGREVRVLLQSTSGTASFSGASRAGGQGALAGARPTASAAAPAAQVQLLSPPRAACSRRSPRRCARPGPRRSRSRGAPATGARTAPTAARSSSAPARSAGSTRSTRSGSTTTCRASSRSSRRRRGRSRRSRPRPSRRARTRSTTSKGGDGFDHYPDTRSQVYGGAGVEVASTNAATQATAGQLVTYQGTPVATYFFSTSGGRTEDVENTSLGTTPQPWLKSVEDEFDDVSPRHRWGPIRMTYGSARAKLGSLVRGRFKGIKVITRGRSPRIVAADVVGSGGRTRVDGATLRARFGLYDTWAYFSSITSRKAPQAAAAGRPGDGGSEAPVVARAPRIASLAGSVLPARRAPRSPSSGASAASGSPRARPPHGAAAATATASPRRASTACATRATTGPSVRIR